MRHLHNPRLWRILLVSMLVFLGFIAFWPTPVDKPVEGTLAGILDSLHRHGIPAWFNYKFIEAAANVVLFIPLGFVGSAAFPQERWWQIGLYGLLTSGCMEVGQLLFLCNRFSSMQDLVTNTSGAVIGALLAAAVLNRLEARRTPAADLKNGL